MFLLLNGKEDMSIIAENSTTLHSITLEEPEQPFTGITEYPKQSVRPAQNQCGTNSSSGFLKVLWRSLVLYLPSASNDEAPPGPILQMK